MKKQNVVKVYVCAPVPVWHRVLFTSVSTDRTEAPLFIYKVSINFVDRLSQPTLYIVVTWGEPAHVDHVAAFGSFRLTPGQHDDRLLFWLDHRRFLMAMVRFAAAYAKAQSANNEQ